MLSSARALALPRKAMKFFSSEEDSGAPAV